MDSRLSVFPSGLHNTGQSSMQNGVIRSAGIHSELVPQHQTVINACVPFEALMAERNTTDPKAYPVGSSPDVFSAIQYELAFSLGSGAQRSQHSFDSLPEVFTCANGLNKNEHTVRFMGQVQNSVFDETKDNAVSLRVHGLTTILNSGDEVIEAGDLVVWDWPLMTGDKKPGFQIQGDVANKFRFATRPLRRSSSTAALMGVFNEFKRICIGVSGADTHQESLPIIRGDDDMKSRVRTQLTSSVSSSSLSNIEQAKAVLQRFANLLIASVGNTGREVNFVNGTVPVFSSQGLLPLTNARSSSSSSSSNNNNLMRFAMHRDDRFMPAAKREKIIDLDSGVANAIAAGEAFVTLVPVIIVLEAELNALLESRVIGRAVSMALPGQRLDMLINQSSNSL